VLLLLIGRANVRLDMPNDALLWVFVGRPNVERNYRNKMIIEALEGAPSWSHTVESQLVAVDQVALECSRISGRISFNWTKDAGLKPGP